MTSLLVAEDFVHLDIPSLVEQNTSTRLHYGRTQYSGACPYPDCSVDENGFIVWSELSKQGRHFYCRGCKRSGDIVKLLQDMKGISFSEAKALLEIGQGKPAIPRRKPTYSERQKKEREFLTDCYSYLRRGLQLERASAYLAQRGIPLKTAQQHGLCYVPPYKEMDEETQDAWHFMKQWTDRLIFPLSGGGFTGRALFLWQPGMDEDAHKAALDAFNEKVKVYNRRASVKKPEIPRWYTTIAPGYFHGDVLKTCEHITVVEGPFDALALLAGEIPGVVAAGRDGIRSDDLPVNVLSATLAYDSDAHGQEAARRDEKIFRRKGIRTIRCTPSEQESAAGKDWSARYRLQGKEGLSRLQAALQSHDILLCCVCGKDALASPDIFSYDEQGQLYCPVDFPVCEEKHELL